MFHYLGFYYTNFLLKTLSKFINIESCNKNIKIYLFLTLAPIINKKDFQAQPIC